MRIKVRRGRKTKLWMVHWHYPLDFRSYSIQFFDTWHEAIQEAIYRSERMKTCNQS